MSNWTDIKSKAPIDEKALYWVLTGEEGAEPVLARFNDYRSLGGVRDYWQTLSHDDFSMEGTKWQEIEKPTAKTDGAVFAKLFHSEECGQILVKIDNGEDGAEVRYFFEPKGLGVCSVAANWSEDCNEVQWEKADALFARADREHCVGVVEGIAAKISAQFAEGGE